MRKLAKTISNQGHGKMGYIFDMTETEIVALKKYFSGKKLKKGCALDLALYSFKKGLPKVKVDKERMAEMLNPKFNHKN